MVLKWTKTGSVNRHRRKLIVPAAALLLAVASACAPANAQKPEIVVRVDRSSTYLGEQVLCEVRMINIDDPAAPVFDNLSGVDVESLGKSSRDEQSISMINGRVSQVVKKTTIFSFRLSPRRAGEITIPPITTDVDGNEISSRPVTIRVVEPPEQDVVLLRYNSDGSLDTSFGDNGVVTTNLGNCGFNDEIQVR